MPVVITFVAVKLGSFVKIPDLIHPRYPKVGVYGRVGMMEGGALSTVLTIILPEDLGHGLLVKRSINLVEVVEQSDVPIGQLEILGLRLR